MIDHPSKTRLENIKIEYITLLKNIKSFPDASPMKKRAHDELSKYLESVRDRFGQEVVNKTTGIHKAKISVMCEKCGVEISKKRISKHRKKCKTI